MPFVYQAKTQDQLRSQYYRISRSGNNGFLSLDDFQDWYHGQEMVCHYCQVTEEEIQEIVLKGLLTSKRFPQHGVVGQGTNRAVWLEIDRYFPNGQYSRVNAVLCCTLCNNDKSDVFDGDMYKEFLQNRVTFLRNLLNQTAQK